MKNKWMTLCLACAVVIAVYVLSARSGFVTSYSLHPADEYYNLLVQGFRAGHLSVKKGVPPGLAQLSNPYDPAANARFPLLDMSYYRGKLYLYYGVAPAVLAFWPYAALTGGYLSQKDAALLFCVVGFLFSSGLLVDMWRRYFAEVGVWVVATVVVLLGLTAGAPALLARCDVWEADISCANALVMIAIAAIWRASEVPYHRSRWLAVASLAYGLAVGTRPNLLFGAVILLIPVFQVWRNERHLFLRPLISTLGPIAAVGFGLMLYNYLRFDDPFEFGLRYAFSPDANLQSAFERFSLRYFWFHFRVYFLAPPARNRQFPFVHDVALPPLPKGHGDVEHVFGVLANIPVVWLALAVPVAWRDRSVDARSRLRQFLISVALLLGINTLTLALFFSASIRYEMEFLPPLALLAAIGILSLERAAAGRPSWRYTARCGYILLLSFSVAFNLLMSLVRRAEAQNRFGKILLKEGRALEAVEQFQQVVYLQPDFAEAHGNLGAALTKRGRVQEAVQQYELALRLKPEFTGASIDLADLLTAQGKANEAIDVYERALRIQPDKPLLHNNLGATLIIQGRAQEAIQQYEQALRFEPDFVSAHYNLGIALAQLGNQQEAMEHWEQVVRLEPGHAPAHYNLGLALAKAGRIEEAVAHWEEAVRINPNLTDAHYNLGLALEQLGRSREAVEQYRQTLELRPDFAPAKDALTRLRQSQ